MDEIHRRQLRGQAEAHYRHPPRAYHNWAHVEACLREWEPVRALCADPVAVEWAIWFHDCIYDPTLKDNELRSADIAQTTLRAAGAAEPLIATVRELILDTRHTAAPATPDGALLVDIDLSILGQPRERYDEYERAIREEYAHVPAAVFAAGRTAVLRSFLDRPRIYRTPWFFDCYESAARVNLARAIGDLGRVAP